MFYDCGTKSAQQSVKNSLDFTLQTTLVLLAPNHEVGDERIQSWSENIFGQHDCSYLDKSENGSYDLTVVTCQEEINGMHEISQVCRRQLGMEFEEESRECCH